MKRTYVKPEMDSFIMNVEDMICLSYTDTEADMSKVLGNDEFENVFEDLW